MKGNLSLIALQFLWHSCVWSRRAVMVKTGDYLFVYMHLSRHPQAVRTRVSIAGALIPCSSMYRKASNEGNPVDLSV